MGFNTKMVYSVYSWMMCGTPILGYLQYHDVGTLLYPSEHGLTAADWIFG